MWPRSGGDRGNRSVIPAVGPTLRRVAHAIPLAAPPMPVNGLVRVAGGATAADGSLRVVLRGVVFAIDPDTWAVRWSRNLRELAIRRELEADDVDELGNELVEAEAPPPEVPHVSLPSILGTDRTLVTALGTAIILDARGELVDRIVVPMADDSGPAPNTDLAGRPIFTTMDGDVLVWHAEGLRCIGQGFGYDIVPVAVFADGTFAVSGYGGRGFCRVRDDGETIWKSDLEDPDLLPTVSRAQFSAVGSLNDHCSVVFDPDGRRVGTYAAAAVFAEYEADGGWIALATDSLARLTPTGEVRWSQPLVPRGTARWGCYQPLVDAEGTIYIVGNDGIESFDATGSRRATLALGGPPMPMFPVRAGLMATIVGDSLLVLE